MLGSFETAGGTPRAELFRLWVFRRLDVVIPLRAVARLP